MVTIQFQFSILDEAIITRNNIKGTVKGLYIDEDSIKLAFVEYATTDGKIIKDYFRESALRVPDGTGW